MKRKPKKKVVKKRKSKKLKLKVKPGVEVDFTGLPMNPFDPGNYI